MALLPGPVDQSVSQGQFQGLHHRSELIGIMESLDSCEPGGSFIEAARICRPNFFGARGPNSAATRLRSLLGTSRHTLCGKVMKNVGFSAAAIPQNKTSSNTANARRENEPMLRNSLQNNWSLLSSFTFLLFPLTFLDLLILTFLYLFCLSFLCLSSCSDLELSRSEVILN